MERYEFNIVIDRLIEDVFEFLANLFKRQAFWSIGMTSEELFQIRIRRAYYDEMLRLIIL